MRKSREEVPGQTTGIAQEELCLVNKAVYKAKSEGKNKVNRFGID